MVPTFVAFLLAAPAADVPTAPPPRSIPPATTFDLADWTPRPATGFAAPWEKMTDKDWIDPRFREMNTGPFLNCTMRYPFDKRHEMVYKATVVKLGGKNDAAAVFDRCTLRMNSTWTGGYLNHSDRRFGLLNTPTPKGPVLSASTSAPGWADPQGKWDARVPRFTAPIAREWAQYRGLYLHDDRVALAYTVGPRAVLESAESVTASDYQLVASALEVGPGKTEAKRFLCDLVGGNSTSLETKGLSVVISGTGARVRLAWVRHTGGIALDIGSTASIVVAASEKPVRFTTGVADVAAKDVDKLVAALAKLPETTELSVLTKAGSKRWGAPIVTKLDRGDESGPFAVDTLTVPYKNRFNALFFCTGLDFLPDGRVAMCTCHGDVWLITVNEKAGTCSWQRYATGLYHSLGLKVVDGKVVVVERGQLTRLHDLNNDGEADFYECVNNDWHCSGGEHSYDTCLETDPQGNFYFFKTGDTDTPTGGCLMKVSKDGRKSEVFSTGFRHPIGMGMSPTGLLTGADQEGNWMPATRIDQYKQGGFYGDMRAHHRATPPTIYDPPLCWLPREFDNSAGGQTWVPKDTFGPLAGLPIHFSYGRCRPFVLLRQDLPNGGVQGGAVALGVQFLSGVCRGRFGPDGNLYACGLNGWQTAAQADGCLQRVRYTGKALDVPTAMVVRGNTIRLAFSRPLDTKAITASDNYRCAWWNYRWGSEYGSKRWKVSNPNAEGQDEVPVRSAKLLPDGRTLELTFDALKPVMQMQVGYNVKSADGKPVTGSVFLTIHSTGK
ncbi:multifunctional secreted protein : Putative large multi-functional protein OS=Blastopirellula marina DSM 3645 GN=DSM3645_26609 PE=4 SV=1 [Gemmata massiliana]|uniref:Multifunctional secreted protein: Putative large multi-functional protein n=1 Tax=Gemmata massiliana TaxID=1210884 RepID=A0A6P2D2M2_9BACT|nr:DUF6797 domain-containing protein [Gemmata massiliana]VTR95541.1 multifunctional secreted protein : Putative large multi-functional protein OS=Blastopirellula marina DSM 3645 GN=DSM3645_26609 PE=4 SV=1 [Gemmata massiliana]